MLKRLFRPSVFFLGLLGLAAIGGALYFGIVYGVEPALRAEDDALRFVHQVIMPMVPTVAFWGLITVGALFLLGAAYYFIIPGKSKRSAASGSSPVSKRDGGPDGM